MIPTVTDWSKPYIFINYCHDNWAQIKPILEQLTQDGYRIWYDQGIPAGKNWRETVENHIVNSAVFLSFLSVGSGDSQHCKAEISCALDYDKPIVCVQLETIEWTALQWRGIGMYLRGYQMIDLFSDRKQTVQQFCARLLTAYNFSDCKASDTDNALRPEIRQLEPCDPLENAAAVTEPTSNKPTDTPSPQQDVNVSKQTAVTKLPVSRADTLPDDVPMQVIDGSCTIPDGVTRIQSEAFYWNEALRRVQFPPSVIKIENSAFWSCSSLEEINFCDGLTQIGHDCFAYCRSVHTLRLPNSLVKLGYDAFAHCTALQSIQLPDAVRTLPKRLFSGCTALTDVHLPKNLTRIGMQAFADCTGLQKLHLPQHLRVIEPDAFIGVTADVYYPADCADAEWIGENFGGTLTWIAEETPDSTDQPVSLPEVLPEKPPVCEILYAKDVKLDAGQTKYIVPNGVRKLATKVFSGKTDLEQIVLPDGLREIGNSAFIWCENLHTLVLPASLKTIGVSAFCGCSALESLILPDGVTDVDADAFIYCGNLRAIYLPDSVKQLGSGAFSGCKRLEEVQLSASIRSILPRLFSDCTALERIKLPDRVHRIAMDAFSGCTALTEIWLGEHIDFIDAAAFSGVGAVVHYPRSCEHKAWVGQNYGGTLRWVADD